VVFVLDSCSAILLLDRSQCRRLDEDPTVLHRFKVHVQTFDWQMGAKDISWDARLFNTANHIANLRQFPLLQQYQ
jgi:hypothetical protein